MIFVFMNVLWCESYDEEQRPFRDILCVSWKKINTKNNEETKYSKNVRPKYYETCDPWVLKKIPYYRTVIFQGKELDEQLENISRRFGEVDVLVTWTSIESEILLAKMDEANISHSKPRCICMQDVMFTIMGKVVGFDNCINRWNIVNNDKKMSYSLWRAYGLHNIYDAVMQEHQLIEKCRVKYIRRKGNDIVHYPDCFHLKNIDEDNVEEVVGVDSLGYLCLCKNCMNKHNLNKKIVTNGIERLPNKRKKNISKRKKKKILSLARLYHFLCDVYSDFFIVNSDSELWKIYYDTKILYVLHANSYNEDAILHAAESDKYFHRQLFKGNCLEDLFEFIHDHKMYRLE
ncbi:MAG: hypothetical protein Q4D51_10925 [Eubacteriales bacterium]|nr:hypothetical protein [Eubacteriales bacterium]